MSSVKKIYLAVAGGLVATGLVLAAIGFVASGFNLAVFNTQIDLRDDTIILGGVEIDDPTGLPLIEQLAEVGDKTPRPGDVAVPSIGRDREHKECSRRPTQSSHLPVVSKQHPDEKRRGDYARAGDDVGSIPVALLCGGPSFRGGGLSH